MAEDVKPMANGILHVCGGDPEKEAKLLDDFKYSPRMWR